MKIRFMLADCGSAPFIVQMRTPRRSATRWKSVAIVGGIFLLSTAFLEGCATQNPQVQAAREQRPFFQTEQATETHGRKNWFDHLIEVDPGKLEVEMASDYQEHAPAVIAVMPFGDKGSANFTVDKIPITFRNQQEQDQWAWTDAQRLRRSVMGFLAEREFTVINPIAVDAVLKARGIDSMEKLRKTSPIELGKLLGADALVYGEVNNYEGYYFGLVSAYRVGISTWMLSTRDGETLMRETGGRYSVDLSPALSPQDALINSVMTLLEFRDVTLARAEEEVGRELVLRIPASEKLKAQIASDALKHADEVESQELEADVAPSTREKAPMAAPFTSSTMLTRAGDAHLESAIFRYGAVSNVGETSRPAAK
jgi:hypothetical protein